MNRFVFSTLPLAVLVCSPISALGEASVSELFSASFAGEAGDATVFLPDYSYSGYDFMESAVPNVDGPIFAVEDFGAIADDETSDRDAIQSAIDAASVGGGVVLFKKGRYLLNTIGGTEVPIRINFSGVVLRGSGSGEEGTELAFARHQEPEDPAKMYSTPFTLQISPVNTTEVHLSKIAEKSEIGSFSIRLTQVGELSPGDWITLRLGDPSAVASVFGDRPIRGEWERLKTSGIGVSERHQIAAIDGNTVTLRAPLQMGVDPQYDWSVRTYPAIERVGIEGLRFVGGWKQDFVHHRSALDDGGWSAIYLRSVRNGWIRDVSLLNWNYGIRLDDCSAFSVLNVRLEGTPGHHAIHARGGYGVLFGLVSDTAGHYHGPSVGYMSASTVFWRCEHGADSSFDAHSTGPYATLLDACRGGWDYGYSGGPLAGMPNHLRGLTLWNFERTGGKEKRFDFWRQEYNKRDLFLDAIVVGFHGIETAFDKSSLGYLESLGRPVEPESLFEAQLARRLGALPEHLKKELQKR